MRRIQSASNSGLGAVFIISLESGFGAGLAASEWLQCHWRDYTVTGPQSFDGPGWAIFGPNRRDGTIFAGSKRILAKKT